MNGFKGEGFIIMSLDKEYVVLLFFFLVWNWWSGFVVMRGGSIRVFVGVGISIWYDVGY